VYRSTTFMKDSKWDKFILKNRIAKTRAGTFLAAGFSAFSLDIHMGISWAFDIEIKWFKSPNSSTRLGL
jgi:hypothetical protein